MRQNRSLPPRPKGDIPPLAPTSDFGRGDPDRADPLQTFPSSTARIRLPHRNRRSSSCCHQDHGHMLRRSRGYIADGDRGRPRYCRHWLVLLHARRALQPRSHTTNRPYRHCWVSQFPCCVVARSRSAPSRAARSRSRGGIKSAKGCRPSTATQHHNKVAL